MSSRDHEGVKHTKQNSTLFRALPAFVGKVAVGPLRWRLVIPALLIFGLLLRLGRLLWQPLWADEGYSVYFATEPLPRLLWLTAHDIHPPLYYLLLHGWLKLWPSPGPLPLRLFSVLLATPVLWLGFVVARVLLTRRTPTVLFLLLLLLNPLYLYYSQEVRMYGLALSLSLATTLCCWQWLVQHKSGRAAWGWLGAYVVAATLALYTLYYLAFLLLAQVLWVTWTLRKLRQPLLAFWVADSVVALLYLPWVIYTARVLVTYVNAKVRSDQDVALGPGAYLLRHGLAFVAGHLPLPGGGVVLAGAALLCTLGLLGWVLWRAPRATATTCKPAAQTLLWLCLVVPVLAAFLINRRYPFFPVGGERLLLFVLPYFLLLIAGAFAELWQKKQAVWRLLGGVGLGLLLAAAGLGDWVFYTLPRYQDDDYRPLIRQIVQQGSDADTVVATFPWQVGFWRAYAPLNGLTGAAGPQLQLLSDQAVRWGPPVAALLDAALDRGLVWIPSLRSIGSTLPLAIDTYMAGRAVNFVHRWSSATTLLDGWHRPVALTALPVTADWGDVKLVSAGVSTTTVPAANYPLVVELQWQQQAPLAAAGVTLRLQQGEQSWAYRDYDKIGAFATTQDPTQLREQVGFLVPPGLPPGAYTLVIGLTDADQKLRQPSQPAGATALVPLATLTITAPSAPIPLVRLPIQFPLPQPASQQGAALLGYSGGDTVHLAGTALDLTLFWQKQEATATDQQLYLSLLDHSGAGVAGWEGWPLPAYPLSQWPTDALVQMPTSFQIPATVASGAYQLITGFLDPATGVKTPPIALGTIMVHQRRANFTPVTPPRLLPAPAQFGTHVQLLGYDLQETNQQINITLYWHVLQPLAPPHQIFIHVDRADGLTLAQTDDTPQDANGPAPTGSWQAGEYLVTHHTVNAPVPPDPTAEVRIGLYVPATGARLPLSLAGAPAGDALVLPR